MTLREVEVVAAVQECSGLRVLVRIGGGTAEWVTPNEQGLSRETIEALIDSQNIPVQGR